MGKHIVIKRRKAQPFTAQQAAGDRVKALASQLVHVTGMPYWKALNIAKWRAKHGKSLKIDRIKEPDGSVTRL